jgi:phosphoglycerate kinase
MIFFVLAGKILDQYRIDVTLATMYNIIERGGRYNTY